MQRPLTGRNWESRNSVSESPCVSVCVEDECVTAELRPGRRALKRMLHSTDLRWGPSEVSQENWLGFYGRPR